MPPFMSNCTFFVESRLFCRVTPSCRYSRLFVATREPRQLDYLLHELIIIINIFITTIAIKQRLFNYNKYILIYQGIQSQKSRSYKELLMSVRSHNSKHAIYMKIVFSPRCVLGQDIVTSINVCISLNAPHTCHNVLPRTHQGLKSITFNLHVCCCVNRQTLIFLYKNATSDFVRLDILVVVK